MQQGEHPRASDCEYRHCFGEAVDGCAPLLMQQQKNRGNQRAGVTDTDPPDEIHDGEAPRNGNVNAPNPHTFDQQIRHRNVKQHQQSKGDCKAEHPAFARSAAQNDRANLIGDGRECVTWLQDGSLARVG